ncbi:ShlB/FhaC/HecB family hemolysin secretion/activation protein [Leptolyngbya sp. FACHB-261]|uniref:ShlB/FhaC/HecB family hemolysin secretion/activation protein n=1 Tax=Leptolyngbya sp. FACHB-261 TaxID=2692806 RepID=UPI0018EFB6CE|nr:ShlB/FhaC/HecB family hemolysin secretion/activation protein [Leptolyngbya sp. FACHB-261]
MPSVPERSAPDSERFLVQEIEVLGSTVLQAEIAALTQPLENSELTFEDLIKLRSDITQLYINNGYITSGAFLLNNQNLSSGVVQIQVIEGQLERVDLSGLTHLQEGYVRSRIAVATGRPLNQRRLEQALQLLQLDPLLDQVNAELTAGSAPGRNVLQIRLREAPPFHAGISVANRQSPSVGSVEGNVFAVHDNLFGFGDRLSASYGLTEGLDTYSVSYSVPLNPLDGTLSLSYNNGDSDVVEAPFQNSGIRSDTRTLSLSFRQPILRSPEREVALGLALDLRRSQTFLLDEPFPFGEGPDEQGRSKVTVLRFFQDWVDRQPRRVLAARSQFSLGLDAFDATVNEAGPDGRFFAWLGQFQWVQQLTSRIVSLVRINAQLTPDSLLSLERFSLGGIDTVRGYRQNQLVSDNAVSASLEVRIPVTGDPNVLQLAPFFDFGTGWNRGGAETTTIASVGLGVRWLVLPGLSVQIDYGIPLVTISDQGNSLQDKGLHFELRYQPF